MQRSPEQFIAVILRNTRADRYMCPLRDIINAPLCNGTHKAALIIVGGAGVIIIIVYIIITTSTYSEWPKLQWHMSSFPVEYTIIREALLSRLYSIYSFDSASFSFVLKTQKHILQFRDEHPRFAFYEAASRAIVIHIGIYVHRVPICLYT